MCLTLAYLDVGAAINAWMRMPADSSMRSNCTPIWNGSLALKRGLRTDFAERQIIGSATAS